MVNAPLPEDLPEHSRLSASGAERWMNCPGSQLLAERLELTGEESTFAAEGTAAHELGEFCLMNTHEPWELLGKTFYEHEVDEEMSLAVQMYVDYCRKAVSLYPGADWLIETRVDNPDIHPDFGGTADFMVIAKKILIVIDYKHGVGIAKDAKDNPQLMYYAYGAYMQLTPAQQADIEVVRYVIVQPRAFHPDGKIRVSGMNIDELVVWAESELVPAMHAVDEPDQPLKTGEHCRFCPAKIGCPVMQSMFKAAAAAKPKDAQVHSDDELGLEYERVSVVRMYLKAIQDEAFARASKGKKIPGGKMVQGKSDRVFNDDADPEKEFGDRAYAERKLKSPAQIEKLPGGPKFVAANAYKPKGKPSFVPLSNRSAEISVTPIEKKFAGIKSKRSKTNVEETNDIEF